MLQSSESSSSSTHIILSFFITNSFFIALFSIVVLFKIAGFPINNLRTNIFSSIFLRGNLFILRILITRSSCAQCTPRQHTKLYIYHIIIIQQFAYIASNATQFCFTADSILVVRFRIGTHTLRAPNPFRCIS